MGVPYSHISPEEGIKNQSLSNVLEQYKKRELNDWNDMSYADSIFKMIDDVIAYQLDKMTDMELDDFYRAHMQHFYEDKRNAKEFNDAWMEYNKYIPEAYPYTHPIRDIPDYSRVKKHNE